MTKKHLEFIWIFIKRGRWLKENGRINETHEIWWKEEPFLPDCGFGSSHSQGWKVY
jgi:hypothetical protein